MRIFLIMEFAQLFMQFFNPYMSICVYGNALRGMSDNLLDVYLINLADGGLRYKSVSGVMESMRCLHHLIDFRKIPTDIVVIDDVRTVIVANQPSVFRFSNE